MKYKVVDIIWFKKFHDSDAKIIEIMIYHDNPQYKFKIFGDEHYDIHIMNCDYIEKNTELDIKSMRKQKLKQLYEI